MALLPTLDDPPAACPVCGGAGPRPFMAVAGRDYWRCDACEATFLDPGQRPTPDEEFSHYQHHQNDPDDPRYREFLSKLAEPLLAKLKPGMTGLDYGCGPGPALAAMLEEAGVEMALYDPFFRDDPAVLQRRYDVIVLSEVAEHLFDPAAEFGRLDRLLKPGGWLGVMTCFQTDDTRFAAWHYRRDPTHVVFYRAATLQVVAEQRGWRLEIPCKDVALLTKPNP
ncbi:MAG: class I SAM-dependent methyltransferase [Alphaproteobacteria bacterium]|nr:class I SAM-dependent methyltransferase [Alphaproteobacteria bacterium]